MRDPLAKRREMIRGKPLTKSSRDSQDQKATDKQYIGLVTEEQFDFIRELTLRVKSPKINKSSILRAMIELLKEVDFDYNVIKSERDFIEAVKSGIN